MFHYFYGLLLSYLGCNTLSFLVISDLVSFFSTNSSVYVDYDILDNPNSVSSIVLLYSSLILYDLDNDMLISFNLSYIYIISFSICYFSSSSASISAYISSLPFLTLSILLTNFWFLVFFWGLLLLVPLFRCSSTCDRLSYSYCYYYCCYI